MTILKAVGANKPLVYQDDTGARILSLIRENQVEPPPKRKEMYTTVLRFEGVRSVCLYFTGRRHAGENLDAFWLIEIRGSHPSNGCPTAWRPIPPKQHQDQTLDINCLAHGRRKFIEIDK